MKFDPAILTTREVYLPLLVAVGAYIVLWAVKKFGIARLKKVSASTDTYLDDLVMNVLSVTRQFFMIGVSLFIGLQFTHLSKKYGIVANKVFVILIAIQAIIWVREAVKKLG